VLLILCAVVAIRMPLIQTFLVRQASDYLSASLETKVTVGSVRMEPFRKLVLHDVFVADQRGDTLLFSGSIKVSLNAYSLKQRFAYAGTLQLMDTRIRVVTWAGGKERNVDFIFDALTPKDTSAGTPWQVRAGLVSMERIRLTYRDENDTVRKSIMNFNDLDLTLARAAFGEVRYEGDSLAASIDAFTLSDKSGFAIDDLTAGPVVATPAGIRVSRFHLVTGTSDVRMDVSLAHNDEGNLKHFIDSVDMSMDLSLSYVSTADLAFFVPGLAGVDQRIAFRGDASGTISQLRLRHFQISYGDQTHFSGRARLSGLPDLEETFIDLVVDDLTFTARDIASMPAAFFGGRRPDIPPQIAQLGKVEFKGKFTGFYNDFVAYGNAQTGLGYVSSDLNLKFRDVPTYSGHLSTIGFDLGALTGAGSRLGRLSVNTEIEGRYFDLSRLAASLKGEVNAIEAFGHEYRNITIDADLSRRLFNGALTVHEENLDLRFNGKMDFTGKDPVFDFNADIANARLARLNLVRRDSSSTLSVRSGIQVVGSSLDRFDGTITLSDLNYSEAGKSIRTDAISLSSTMEGQTRLISLQSEFATMTIRGNYRRSSVVDAFIDLLRKYVPGGEPGIVTVPEIQDFEYDIRVLNPGPLLAVFAPSMTLSPGARVSGIFHSLENEFSLLAHADEFRWREVVASDLALKGNTAGSNFDVLCTSGTLAFRDSLVLNHLRLEGLTNKSTGRFAFSFHGRDSTLDNVNIETAMDYVAGDRVMVQVLPSRVTVEGTPWTTDPNNRVIIDSTFVVFESVNLRSGDQQLALDGRIGNTYDQVLSVRLSRFGLHPAGKVLSTFGLDVDGTASGSVSVASVSRAPHVNADLFVRDLTFLGDTLGDARILGEYHAGIQKIRADLTIGRGDTRNFAINGTYFFGDKDSLDFVAKLEKASIRPLEPHLDGFCHDLRGYLTGTVTLTGSGANPRLAGEVRLQKCSFLVDYLNTRFSLSDKVQILPDRFVFDKVKLNDPNGRHAVADGYIHHSSFRDFGIEMTIQADKVTCLNTSVSDNELFYGTGVATGKMRIYGPFEKISFDGALRAERGTEISIPLSNPEDITASSFISFVTHDTAATAPVAVEPVDLSGIDMKLDLEMTDDALVKLIYDEKIGDKLEGRGAGNLMLNIGSDGTFTMRGDYTVTSGNYVFTLQNVINKRFDLEQGGVIKWNGSPYEADIHVDAVYSRRASLYDLLRDTTSGYKNRVAVEVVLQLRNRLQNPDVKFEIRIPDVDPATQGQIRSAIVTEEENNQQALSLLVLNRFSPGRNQGGKNESSGGAIGANASELLSVQASNWLQSLTDQVDIGINYRAGDKFNSEELEIMLGKKFLNDRITVETKVGYTGNNYTPVDQQQNTSNLVGDFNIDLQLTENNRLHFKAFNRSNNVSFLDNFNSQYTQGIGLFYRQEFNSLRDIFGLKRPVSGEEPQP